MRSATIQAQIVPDSSLGTENSVVTPDVLINGVLSDRLDGGALRDSNLFHSFEAFSVEEGRGAYFANPAGVANIFSRVTGGDISRIMGTLGVLGEANLYFLNPNGIIFGPNARLDVRGAFLATTADSFIFDNNYEFSASNPTAPPLLTVNITIGLRFRDNPGEIVVQTGAAIDEEITVTEVGDAGDLPDSAQAVGSPNEISGNLDSNNDVDLYEVVVEAETPIIPSTVGGSNVDTRLFLFDQSGLGLAANDDSQGTFQSTLPPVAEPGTYFVGVSSFANTPLSNDGNIFTLFLDGFGSGADSPLSGWNNLGFDNGSYTISLSSPTAGTGNLAVPTGQTLALIGGNVRVEGGNIISPGSDVYLGGVGGAGVVPLEQGLKPMIPDSVPRANVDIVDAEINVGAGGGGNISLVGGDINVLGEATSIRAGIESEQGSPSAQAGDINLSGTGLITLNGGNISNRVGSGGMGDAGKIVMTSSSLLIENGGSVNTSLFGKGSTGGISILTSGNITIIGEPSQEIGSSVTSLVGENGKGNIGEVVIESANLSLENGGLILAFTFGQGNSSAISINANESVSLAGETLIQSLVLSTGKGNSGGITIETGTLTLAEGGIIDASTSGTGDSGAIVAKANESVSVTGGASMQSLVLSTGKGNSGGITIETDSLILAEEGTIDASTSGKGNSGVIAIKANETISVTGKASVGSDVLSTGEGNSGGITIETGTLTLAGEGTIDASTEGEGNSGAIVVKAGESVSVTGASMQSLVLSTGEGNSGGITIETDSLILAEEGTIAASALGKGNSGAIAIKANESVSVTGGSFVGSGVFSTGEGNSGGITIGTDTLTVEGDSIINASTLGNGDAGDITLTASVLNLNGNAEVLTFTRSQGNAGSISINAPQIINVGTKSGISVETSAAGRPGNIRVITDTLNLSTDAQLSATATQNATNLEGGGSISLNANNLNIAGRLGIFAETQGQTPAGNLTINPSSDPDINIRFTDSGFISAQTSASGQGGNIDISAPNLIDIRGQGSITTETSGAGNAGTISLNSQRLNLQDGVIVSASSTGSGQGGRLVITAPQSVSLRGSEVSTQATNVGNAGTIDLNSAQVQLAGNSAIRASSQSSRGGDIRLQPLQTLTVDNSEISAATATGTAGSIVINSNDKVQLQNQAQITVEATDGGTAGNLNLTTERLNIIEGSRISVSSPTGQAGNINIQTGDLLLDQGAITAETGKSGVASGANINLSADNLLTLRMRNNSLISATANDFADGGNITINTPFLIAEPTAGGDGSDIIAKALFGDGGRITINALGIFGISEGKAIAGNGTNDIDASSEFGAAGVVQINQALDPNRGLATLPENVIDPSTLIDQNACQQGKQNRSEFTETGRTGLPPSVTDDFDGSTPDVNLIEPGGLPPESPLPPETDSAPPRSSNIDPAQGWQWQVDGTVTLVGQVTESGAARMPVSPKPCPVATP